MGTLLALVSPPAAPTPSMRAMNTMREHNLESTLSIDNGSGLTKVSEPAYPALAQTAKPATLMTLLACLVNRAPTNKQVSQHLKTNRPCVSMTNIRARMYVAATIPPKCMLLGLLMFLLLSLNLLLLLNLMALLGTFLPERHRLTHLYLFRSVKATESASSRDRRIIVTCPDMVKQLPRRLR